MERHLVHTSLLALSAALSGVPATHGQSFSIYARDFARTTLTPETLFTPAMTATFANYVTQPSGFGAADEGLGNHYEVSLGDNIQGKFLRKFAFAAASHHRDQYCPLGTGAPFKERILNVSLHSLFATPQTSRTFNWSGFPGSLVSAALSNTYEPRQQRTVLATFQRFGTNAAGYMFGDFLAEMTFKTKPSLAIRLMIGPR